MYSKVDGAELNQETKCLTNSSGGGGGRRHLTFLATHFNKSENFASFRSKISQRKGSRGRARTLFMSFSSFGLSRSAPQTERETFSHVLHPPLFSAFFCSLCFLFWRKISRIKYGSHMLLLTIGIHHGTRPAATQTETAMTRCGESKLEQMGNVKKIPVVFPGLVRACLC